ncbi:MAG: glycosyltransferase family 4 protein [Armatimonadota bacterium]|jgi:glycosyltransferase involved in cell wall biosynthesis
MTKLRTLHIDSEMAWSGGQRQVSGLCSYLRQWGHDVKIITRPGSKLESWANTESFESFTVDMPSTLSLPSILRMRSIIASLKPDVVHLHASRAHVLGAAAAKLAGARIIIATRRMDDPIKMIWPNTSAYGKWTTAIVAISTAVRDVLVNCGVDVAKIHTIPSGTDIERFKDTATDPQFRSSLTGDHSWPVVSTAASLTERKGIRFLLEAAHLLQKSGKPVRVVIAGDGEQRQELQQIADKMAIVCTFLGQFSDMPKLLANSDIFVMPSLGEGLGVAVLEAMAAGKPIVASAVGGLKESVVDGQTGFLIPPANSQALADALARLLSNSSLIDQFGSAGQARVAEKYSLENMAKGNESLYHKLVQQ